MSVIAAKSPRTYRLSEFSVSLPLFTVTFDFHGSSSSLRIPFLLRPIPTPPSPPPQSVFLHTSSQTTIFPSAVSSSLPFPNEKAKYHGELEAAMDVVERACRLCVDVKRSLFSSEGRVVEKDDNTPVTVADFGVQALVSLELSKLFPTIPLVAEEDSGFLRANNLVDSVVSVVTDKATSNDKPLTHADVLEAIDRGGRNAIVYGSQPATYWILDPIDGTRGFLKGSEALYVVGLALVVEGEIVLGVMGCPNWQEIVSDKSNDIKGPEYVQSRSGMIMVAHVGCGTWMKRLPNMLGISPEAPSSWTRCFVDEYCLVPEARYCIPDSQTWDSLPLSALFSASNDPFAVGDTEILLLPTCCGSLCKYMMVASGRTSVFLLRARAQTIIKAWDHAVGIICVCESGGKVTDWKGNQLNFALDQVERRIIFPSGGVLVTNGNLHDELLELISFRSWGTAWGLGCLVLLAQSWFVHSVTLYGLRLRSFSSFQEIAFPQHPRHCQTSHKFIHLYRLRKSVNLSVD